MGRRARTAEELDPRGVIHQRPVAAEFLDEHVVAQALRLADLGLAGGEAQVEMGIVEVHRNGSRAVPLPRRMPGGPGRA